MLDTMERKLSHIVLRPNEVEIVLETLPICKATGPNGISNRVLRELSSELSSPCVLYLIIHYIQDVYLPLTKMEM